MSTDKPKKSNALIWGIIFAIGAIMLVWSMTTSRTGQVWITPEQHAFTADAEGKYSATDSPAAGDIQWTTYDVVPDSELTQEQSTAAKQH